MARDRRAPLILLDRVGPASRPQRGDPAAFGARLLVGFIVLAAMAFAFGWMFAACTTLHAALAATPVARPNDCRACESGGVVPAVASLTPRDRRGVHIRLCTDHTEKCRELMRELMCARAAKRVSR